MTRDFLRALWCSAGVHAVALIGLPGAIQPAQFDVERAATSVELMLAPPALQVVPVAAVDVPQPPEEPATPEARPVPQPALRAVVAAESRGADVEVAPNYLRNPAPVYPELARERGYEGTVVIEVEVLASGRCGGIRVRSSSGHDLLDQAAVQAVRGWVFRPARRWHTPIPFQVEIPVTFRLIEPASYIPAAALGRAARPARREERGVPAQAVRERRATPRADADRPSPSSDTRLRRPGPVAVVAPPRRPPGRTPSSSRLGHGSGRSQRGSRGHRKPVLDMEGVGR